MRKKKWTSKALGLFRKMTRKRDGSVGRKQFHKTIHAEIYWRDLLGPTNISKINVGVFNKTLQGHTLQMQVSINQILFAILSICKLEEAVDWAYSDWLYHTGNSDGQNLHYSSPQHGRFKTGMLFFKFYKFIIYSLYCLFSFLFWIVLKYL